MESRRFDQLTVTLAAGSTRRRALAGLGAVAMGMLLGRDAEAKSFGNKGNSGTNGNADCNAVCAHEAKVARKQCQDKDKKAAKKGCLKNVKQAQAACRETCVPTDNTGTGSTTTEDAGTGAGGTDTGGDLSILAKDLCTPGGTRCQDDLDASSPGNCLTATCTKSVSDGRYRCQYTRNTDDCSGENHICCNYRRDAKNSGMCVADVEQCKV